MTTTTLAEVLSDATSFIIENQPADRKFEVTDVTPELGAAARTIALHWIAPVKGHWAQNFMYDMKASAMGKKGLSAGQVKGILNVVRADAAKAEKAKAPQTVAQAVADTLNVASVRTARFRVVPDDGKSIAVRLSDALQWTDAPKGTRKISVRQADGWTGVGKVNPDGSVVIWKKAGVYASPVRQALTILANADDDLVFILDYAMEGGHCGFCDLELDTAESLTVGYGPTCAKKHNLPWGAKAIPAKVLLAKSEAAAEAALDTDTDGAVITPSLILRPLTRSDWADDLAAAADLANDVAAGN